MIIIFKLIIASIFRFVKPFLKKLLKNFTNLFDYNDLEDDGSN